MSSPLPTIRRLVAASLEPDRSPPEDQAAFREFARDKTLAIGRVMTLVIFVSALVFWPIDYFWFPNDPVVQRAVSLWRFAALPIMGVTLLVTSIPGFGRRHAYKLLMGCALACVATLSFFLSEIGGIEQPWFHAALLMPFCVLPVQTPLRWRALLELAVLVAWLGTYFLRHPEYLDHVFLPSAIASFSFSAIMATACGHAIYVLVRSNFYQARALALRNVDLTRDNESLADQLAVRLDEVRRLTAHMDRTRDDERRRIAHELHDELGQLVTAMRLDVDRCHRNLEADLAKVREALSRLSESVDGQASLVHRIVEELRPKVLDDLGLVAAAEWLCNLLAKKSGVDIPFRAEPAVIDAPPEVASALYRVLQEALNNALKHARARTIEVTLRESAGTLTLIVSDDGLGLAAAKARASARPAKVASGGLGLIGMRERARAVGGTVLLHSEQRGTRVEVVVPMSADVRPLAIEGQIA